MIFKIYINIISISENRKNFLFFYSYLGAITTSLFALVLKAGNQSGMHATKFYKQHPFNLKFLIYLNTFISEWYWMAGILAVIS